MARRNRRSQSSEGDNSARRQARRRVEARREEILAAAERCFSREGFHQTTMANVIRESGMSAGGIYGHFLRKEDLIAAIAEARHARDARLLARTPMDGSLSSLAALGQAFAADVATPDGKLARRVGLQVWAEALRNDAIRQQVIAGLHPPITLIAETLRKGMAAGEVRSDIDPQAIARLLVATFHGVVLQSLWGETADSGAQMAAFQALLDGLKAR